MALRSIKLISIFVICCLYISLSSQLTGQFWHLTDIHWDVNYTQYGGNPANMCWASTTDSNKGNWSQVDIGKFGNYACDSPWELFMSTLNFMKYYEPDVDFIVWTGDDDSHVSNYFFSTSKVMDIMKNISINIQNAFPKTPVIPTFGNHDAYPKCLFSPQTYSSWYEQTANLWKHWLGSEAYHSFKQGGYYLRAHPTLTDVTIIAMNTPVYYHCNTLVSEVDDADPLGQLAWLDQTLTQLEKNRQKAYIVAHIPPGVMGMNGPPYGRKWFRPQYNQKYVDVILKHADTIIGQFYGHEHKDSFRLFYDHQGKPVNALFVSPAVTPWRNNINPSVRLVSYDLQTGQIENYEQYYLNLTEANELNEANWKKEYDFLSAYDLPDMSYESLDRLAQGFATPDRPYFDRYDVYYSVSYDPNFDCDQKCQRSQYCSTTQVDYEAYNRCNNPNITDNHDRRRLVARSAAHRAAKR